MPKLFRLVLLGVVGGLLSGCPDDAEPNTPDVPVADVVADAGSDATDVGQPDTHPDVAPDTPGPDVVADTPGPDTSEPPCDPAVVFAEQGCTTAGCHGAPVAAELDLTGDDLAERMMAAPAHAAGCEGRFLIDPNNPDQSLLLQAIGAVEAPLGEADKCQVKMPPVGEVSAEAKACLTDWVYEQVEGWDNPNPPLEFEPVTPFSAVRKVKTLLHGGAPTAEEVSAVTADHAALEGLIEGWMTTEAFTTKLDDFLGVALQQDLAGLTPEQFDNARINVAMRDPLARVLAESFVRTARDLVEQGKPFHEVLTTKRWAVTTANLLMLRYPDQTLQDKGSPHSVTNVAEDAPDSVAGMVAAKTWYVPQLQASPCTVAARGVLELLFGFVRGNSCQGGGPNDNTNFTTNFLQESDFNDWRFVEFVDPASDDDLIPFYDLPALRAVTDTMTTRLPRQGFHTTSAFLGNWGTNVDNQFRVTTNQTLLVALGIGFSATEPTEHFSDAAVDTDHADPETSCYGCHKHLDPMRVYFGQSFDVNYQHINYDLPEMSPDFVFRGEQHQGGDLSDFAAYVAGHPLFASAWVQRVCLHANSHRCDETDPLFQEAVQVFVNSDYNLKTLMVHLFASPLITGLEASKTYEYQDPLVSITRRDHLCALLEERLGTEDLCEVNRVATVLPLVPNDQFARGADAPVQPALTSAFHFAGVESLCAEVARTVVKVANPIFTNDPETVIPAVVSQLMGLPEGHPRYQPAVDILVDHYQQTQDQGANKLEGARSVFILACLSADVMGVGL